MTTKKAKPSAKTDTPDPALASQRLGETGRNDPCPCGSGSKYKKCHLRQDEAATAPAVEAPDPKALIMQGWRLFEQRRPGAAEKQFRAALAIEADSIDATVGVGMARLSAGDSDAAKVQFETVLARQEKFAAGLRDKGTKDAFSLPEAQSYIRAAHALGCLAYDKDDHALAVSSLEKVYAIDDGAVGIEARLVAAKAHVKQKKPADAVAVLQPASKSEAGKGRALMGIALGQFLGGDSEQAQTALTAALAENAHYAGALLGTVRARVDNPAAALPGSREEAMLYAQSYGDVWDDAAKEFLRGTPVAQT